MLLCVVNDEGVVLVEELHILFQIIHEKFLHLVVGVFLVQEA